MPLWPHIAPHRPDSSAPEGSSPGSSTHGPEKKKIVLLGSGGLSIGQAGEFDYSGTQALVSLLEEGFEVIVVNPNIATVQTNPRPHTRVYLYPVTAYWVEKIFEIERPHGIVAGFGGQTALGCLIDLGEQGILKKYGVYNLGTSPETLKLTEDRELFAQKMREIGVPTPPSIACHTLDEAIGAAEDIGYPVICRMAYALGGLGSGFAYNRDELIALVEPGLAHSPQVLVEKSLKGWKEIEYEVMRDHEGNGICICNMENFDPLGIHTGDSIVVCPSQTLSDSEYQLLRDSALKVVNALEVLGECNAQFALSPDSMDYYIIEVNARLSRSSALASKASGYPIAFVAAKVVLGYDLLELKNPLTGVTCAFFEPALDYLTLKIPRWDLSKFKGAHRGLDSTMKSVGEIMAIGRSFPEALQKAIRSLTEESVGLSWLRAPIPSDELKSSLSVPTDRRLHHICQAYRQGFSLAQLHETTRIDLWFLREIEDMMICEREILEDFSHHFSSLLIGESADQASNPIPGQPSTEEQPDDKILSAFKRISADTWLKWKMMGFADAQLIFLAYQAYINDHPDDELPPSASTDLFLEVRRIRIAHGVIPRVKKIDTTAAEYPSPSNYLYTTYHGSFDDQIERDARPHAVIIGGGSYRIGTSVEFDWCAVSCSEQLRKSGWQSVIVNCNPETVSTDYNVSDRLYFEEITLERILDVADHCQSEAIVASMGGQLPNKLALPLAKAGLKLLGHSETTIDRAEDRSAFSAILDDLGIDQPRWTSALSRDDVDQFVEEVGFPVLVRPSYVLSGAAMKTAYNRESLNRYLSAAEEISVDHPVVLSEFLTGACEIEVDGVAHQGKILISIVSEHIENAGIHSGDATTVVPAQNLYVETVRQVKKAVRMIAKKLELHGPFNIQFLARDNHIKVIECNARAARSFPFISKIIGCHLAQMATGVMIGRPHAAAHFSEDELPHVGVKAALFSFTRLRGADPVLGVEMAATGEVGCLAGGFEESLLLALEASKIQPPRKGLLISAGKEKNKLKFVECARYLIQMGIPLYATEGTAAYLRERGFAVTLLPWPSPASWEPKSSERNREKSSTDTDQEESHDVLWAIKTGLVDFVVNLPKNHNKEELTNGARIRQAAVNFNCSLITDMEKAISYIKSLAYQPQFPSQHQPKALPNWKS